MSRVGSSGLMDIPGRVPQVSLASGSSGLGAGVTPSQPIAMPSAPPDPSQDMHVGTSLGPWSQRFKDLRVQTGTAAGSNSTRNLTSISGTTPMPSIPAEFTSQGGTERPGTSGTADSSSPPEGLSPRRATQMEKARQAFERNAAHITDQATRALQDTVPAYRPMIASNAQQQIELLRRDLEQTLHRILHPHLHEPARRVEGFEVKSPSP